MSFKIAIASGKGGTGKTTVSVSLFHFLVNRLTKNIQLVDCDVEEPNDIIFFPGIRKAEEKEILQLIPEIDKSKCSFCRKCVEFCEFNAITVIPPVQFAEINESLCHSCGACLVACTDNAIAEYNKLIGHLNFYELPDGKGPAEGKLRIGSTMQTMLIKELKKHISDENEIIIYDAPPGTTCPVVETISDVNYVILVTEPTPFGLHDLKLMIELLYRLDIPFGVIINKAGLGDNSVYEYLTDKNIEILGEIPFNKEFAASYARGNILIDVPDIISKSYTRIMEKIDKRILMHEGDNYFKW